jgi:broad specificity phosphatase PhoE
MTRLLLVRHGETVWNADGRIQGHADVSLSEKGRMQARLAADRLKDEKVTAVYSSDLKRASETGEIIAAVHNLPLVTTPLLREAYLGRWQGLTVEQVEEQYPDEYAAYKQDSVASRPPDAERLEDVISRCSRFLEEVINAHPDDCIAAACHGGSIRGIIAAAFGAGPSIYRHLRLDNGGITILELKESRSILVTLNDVCHLGRR